MGGRGRCGATHSESRSNSPKDSDIHESFTSDMSHSTFKSTLTAILSATNKRVDDLHSLLVTNQERRLTELRAELKAEITETKSMLSHLKETLSFTADEVSELKGQLANANSADTSVAADRLNRIDKELVDHARQIDYLENQSGRNNVRINGIQEDRGESWDTTESKCRTFFTNTLGLPQILIERAHRTGPPQPPGGRPRPIIVRLGSFKHREAILRRAKERKPRGIFLNQDFSARMSRVRKELRPQIQDLRQKGYVAFLSYDKIRYCGHNPDHPNQPRPHSTPSYPGHVPLQQSTAASQPGVTPDIPWRNGQSDKPGPPPGHSTNSFSLPDTCVALSPAIPHDQAAYQEVLPPQ